MATNQNGHQPKRPQTEMATNQNGHKQKRSQARRATSRNGHKREWTQPSDSVSHKIVCLIGVSNLKCRDLVKSNTQ